MPTYTYACGQGHVFEQYSSLAGFQAMRICDCSALATLVITPPLSVTVAPDVCYDSPIDGRPITSWAQRQDDLARSGCRPYDPGMKDDADRRITQDRAAFDQSIDATVEEAIEKMPTHKRGKLYSELTQEGVGVEYVRSTKET